MELSKPIAAATNSSALPADGSGGGSGYAAGAGRVDETTEKKSASQAGVDDDATQLYNDGLSRGGANGGETLSASDDAYSSSSSSSSASSASSSSESSPMENRAKKIRRCAERSGVPMNTI